MEIKTFYSDNKSDKSKPIDYLVEVKCTAQEWRIAQKVVDTALFQVNPLNEDRATGDE